MNFFLYHLYDKIGIPFLYLIFHLYALTNSKIRKGIRGRKNTFRLMEQKMAQLSNEGPRFWIHSSSMGEFEQAKPLIQGLKNKIPASVVMVTVFSPSAYEHIHDYKTADCICYLPLDTRRNARRFLSILKPDVGIMVRHDLWPNHLRQLKKDGIPAILINCSISTMGTIHTSSGHMIKRFLFRYFDLIMTVSSKTTQYCREHILVQGNIETVGDTRYDQVVARAREAENIVMPLRKLKGNRKGFVVGSTWPSDEEVVLKSLSMLRDEGIHPWVVLVPHEPTEEHLEQIEQNLRDLHLSSPRFSEVTEKASNDTDVLVVDRVGILASLYALGELSYVGGGFGPGIHSVLEPAALGKVVLFGPKHKNSYEAGQLKNRGAGIAVDSSETLFDLLHSFFKDPSRLNTMGEMAAAIVQENVGATERIIQRIEKQIKRL